MWSQLSEEGVVILGKGVYECLSRWTALQLAIQNSWGGQTSAKKCEEFHSQIMAFFIRSKEQRYIDELEDLLDDFLLESFNTEIADGSIFEVAEQLMIIHEECVKGNFEAVRQMFAKPCGSGAQKSKELPSAEGDEPAEGSSSEDEEDVDMQEDDVPAPNATSSAIPKAAVQSNLTEEEMADGWQEAPVRSRRRNTTR